MRQRRVVGTRVSRGLYRMILWLYPKGFRQRHGADMLRLFLAVERDTASVSGRWGVAAYWASEVVDGLRRAASLRYRAVTTVLLGPPGWYGSSSGAPRGNGMDTLTQDLRFALRSLLRRPMFTSVAVVTIAIGVGANTAIFGVLNNVVLRSLPYPDADRLVRIGQTMARWNWDWAPVSYLNYADWRDQTTMFEGIGAYAWAEKTLLGSEEPERVPGWAVTASLLPLLGVEPEIGRGLTPNDDRPGAEPVIVLSHALWLRSYGGRADVIGRGVTFDDGVYTVVGVMPAGFRYPSRRTRFWVALRGAEGRANRDTSFLSVLGRLAPGETMATAAVELEGIGRRLAEAYPEANEGIGVRLRSHHELVVGEVRPVLLILLGAVVVVLAIACTNIANLLLSRASVRQREIAVRTALGAARGRLVRQLLTESLVLALFGGALGAAFAIGATRVLLAIGPDSIPRRAEIGVDGAALAFTLVVSLACGLVFGLVPALKTTKPDAQSALRAGAVGVAGRASRHQLQQGLAATQVAMALVLVVGAGLLLNSFVRLLAVDPGFHPEQVLAARISLPMSRYQQPVASRQFFTDVTRRVAGLPGIRAAGATFSLPLSQSNASRTFVVEGRGTLPGEEPVAGNVLVSGQYHQAMGISILRGRGFLDSDDADAPLVTVINETMAQRVWPNEDPIGRRIKLGGADRDNPWWTVVGIAGDVRRQQLGEGPGPEFYQPHAQVRWGRAMFIVARTDGDPLDHAAAIRRQIHEIDGNLPVTDMSTMTQLLSDSVAEPRFRTFVVASFAVVAGLLALVGIYGVMAFTVSERTREIGVRMALGAARRDVLREVMNRGMRLTAVGLAVGLTAALGVTRVLSALLFGVTPSDPWTYVAGALVMAAVAGLACYLPARRASRVDPLVAMRNE